jgi:hypothetical protein
MGSEISFATQTGFEAHPAFRTMSFLGVKLSELGKNNPPSFKARLLYLRLPPLPV